MKLHLHRRAAMVLAVIAAMGYGEAAQCASGRAGKIDMGLQFSDVGSQNISGNLGSSAAVNSDAGLGFNFAYNVDNHWAFGLEFSWREAGYSTTTTPDVGNPNPAFTSSGTLDVSTTALTATYHFSPSSFTPLVTANLGRTWIDTNIPNGPPTNVCWWDPWWGYYCGPVVPTKSDVYWSYGLGLGVRWDSQGPFFLRGLVNEQWIDVGGNVGTPSFTIYRVDLGFRF